MLKRTVLALAILAVVAVSLVLGWVTYHGFSGTETAEISVGGPFALQDGDGKTVSDQDFRGKFMLIYFGYTHCPDACPTALNAMAVALDKLGDQKSRVVPIFITVDPERDTGAVMKDYVAAFGTPIVGLTGDPATLKRVEKEFRVYAEKHPTDGGGYDMDHSSVIYVMDGNDHFVGNFTHETTPDEIAAKLKNLLAVS